MSEQPLQVVALPSLSTATAQAILNDFDFGNAR